MPNLYQVAADAIVLVHMAYVLIVVFGLPAIWIGIFCRAKWVRNFWLRVGHLVMILIVVGESWAGITCPLTIWEQQLRVQAQQETYHGNFIANCVHDWLFYDAPHWAFTAAYTTFGLLVLASFIAAPPRWPKRHPPTPPSS